MGKGAGQSKVCMSTLRSLRGAICLDGKKEHTVELWHVSGVGRASRDYCVTA